MSRRSGSNGFTLIELMITVAVVAILSAVALPSYQAYVRKSARSAAQSFMMAVAGRQEQIMLDQRTYVAVTANANFPLAPSSGGVNIAVPSDTTGRYTFSVILTTAVTCPAPALYCVIATAVGNQASDGNLGLDSLATKTPAAKWQ